MHDIVPSAPSSDAASLHTLESDESNSTVRNECFSVEGRQMSITEQSCNPIQNPEVLLASHAEHTRAGLDDYTYPCHLRSTPTPFQHFSIPSTSVHAPLSRCSRAHDEHYRIKIDVEACEMCGASKAHYLAIVANTIKKQVLFQRLHTDVTDINPLDSGQNTPLHFLASSGPEPGRIQIFERAGANILSKNGNGDTFLHVLEPSKLRGPHLTELLTWSVMKGVDLKRRNYDGKNFLHCLVERRLNHDDWINVLTALQSAPKRPIASDSSHSPLTDCLLARDNRGRTVLEIICANPDSSYLQDLGYFLPISQFDHHFGYTDAALGRSRPTAESLQEKDKIMRNTVLLSANDPTAKNPGDDMSALSCLAHIVRLCPEYETDLQPLFARETELKKCLKYGVDPNDYDCSGSPPLHHFVSTFRNNESDDKTADLIAWLIFYGADVNMRNAKGESALHVACQLGRVSCVKKLIMYKANVQALDYRWEGIIVSAKHWMDKNRENNARIQECIELVCRAANVQCR
jgi:ankyrin repeat protein